MRRNTILSLAGGAVIAGLAVMLAPGLVLSHCQVPCGIYDDAARVVRMYEDATTIEYAVLADPCRPEPLCAQRRIGRKEDGSYDYDAKSCKWVRTTLRDDLTGFATSRRRNKASKGQKSWWTRRARARGLDPSTVDEITQRQFAALPILENLNRSMLV